MSKKGYVVLGITDEMLKHFADDFREDLKLFKNEDSVIPIMLLNGKEALQMRLSMLSWNLRTGQHFGLRRI